MATTKDKSRNRSIKSRVYLQVGLSLFVALFLGAISLFIFNTLDVIGLIGRLERSHTVSYFQATNHLSKYINTQASEELDRFVELMEKVTSYEEYFGNFNEHAKNDSLSKIAQDMFEIYEEFPDFEMAQATALRLKLLISLPIAQKLVDLASRATIMGDELEQVGRKLISATDDQTRFRLLNRADQLNADMNNIASEFSDLTGELAAFAIMVSSLAYALLVFAAIIGILTVARKTVLPMNQGIGRILASLKELSEGNLDFKIKPEEYEEFILISDDMRKVQTNLKRIVNEVTDITTELNTNATALASTSEQLNVGASQQADSIEIINNAMSQLATTEEERLTHLHDISDMSEETQRLSGNACERARATITGMETIRTSVEASATHIEKLHASSAEIQNIVCSIKSIAEQTNLLSLNAAIEAARAGEQGRGFSVVADEVRQLADHAHTATTNVSDMLSDISKQIESSVETMQTCRAEVSSEQSHVNEMERALSSILDASTACMTRIKQISETSTEYATTTANITQDIANISTVSQESQHGTQAAAETAQGLNQISSGLSQALGWFQTDHHKTKAKNADCIEAD